MFEMMRGAALSGILGAEDMLISQATFTGDDSTRKRIESSKPAKLRKKTLTEIMGFATVQGVEWAQFYEKQIKEIFTDAMMNKTPLGDVQAALRSVFRSEVEPLTDADKTVELARASSDDQRAHDRKMRAGARIWRKQQRELADWRAGKTGEPPWRLAARQNTTRMRTGWQRWYNSQVTARAEADSSVVAFAFSLGIANVHTETCLSRARIGLVVRKGTAAEALNRPPLHWGCKSRYIPLTRAMMKQRGIKPTTKKEMGEVESPEAGFGGGKKLPT